MHLRRGLDAEALACPLSPAQETTSRERADACVPEDFGVDRRVQDALSRVRTDLDSFTHVEAQSLMLDGYLIAENVLDLATEVNALGTPVEPAPTFEFEEIRPWLRAPTPEFLSQLHIARQAWFKYFRLVPRARLFLLAGALLGTVAAGAVAAPVVRDALFTVVTVWTVLALVALPLLLVSLSVIAARSREASETLKPMVFLRTVTVQAMVGAIGSVLTQLHLRFINRGFLRIGHPRALRPPK